MGELDEVRAQLAELAERVRALEDHVELTQLVARYGPSVDSGAAEATAALWCDRGVFDVPGVMTMTGHGEIVAMVDGDGHRGLIENGCAHVLTVPHVVVDGDEARGWNYALNIRWDPGAERFWVARASANTWHWQRTGDGWRTAERVNANLDGSAAPRQMLRASATAATAAGEDEAR